MKNLNKFLLVVLILIGMSFASSSFAANIILNPGFESGTASWVEYSNGSWTFTTSGPASEGSNAAKLQVSSPGTNVQLYQAGITLTVGKEYTLSFDAYSNTGHNMDVSIFKNIADYDNYGLNVSNVDLNTGWASYTYDFTASGFTGTVSDGRLMFWFAPYDAAGDVFWIDNISLAEKVVVDTQAPTVPTNLMATAVSASQINLSWTASTDNVEVAGYRIYRGGSQIATSPTNSYYDTGLSSETTYSYAVSAYDAAGNESAQSSTAQTTTQPVSFDYSIITNPEFESGTDPWIFYSNGSGTFSIESNNGPSFGGSSAAKIQINSPGTNVQFYQDGFTIQAGKSYTLSFDAYSNTGHDVNVSIFKNSSPYTNYGLDVGTVNLGTSYQQYSYDFTSSGFSGTVGDTRLRFWLADTDATGDIFWIDNVHITENVQLYQPNITLQSGELYRLSFDARSNTGHDIDAFIHQHVVPYAYYGYYLEANLSTSWQTFSKDFIAQGFSGTVNDARLRFWFVNDAQPGDIFWIDNVKLNRVVSGSIIPPNLVSNPSFESGLDLWMSHSNNIRFTFSTDSPGSDGSQTAKIHYLGVPDVTAGAAAPTTATVDTPVTLSSTVTNIGVDSTGDDFNSFFQIADGANGTGTILDQPAIWTPTLPASANYLASYSYSFNTSGTHSIRICADKSWSGDSGTITESNEGNNCGAWTNILVSPQATANISANPTVVSYGGSSVLTWSYANATSCTVTPPASVNVPPSSGNGTISTGALYAERTYTISCEPGGVSSVAHVLVEIESQKFDLNVTKSGQGRVVGVPDPVQSNINCGLTCEANYDSDTSIVLTATPDPGRSFVGWGGDCASAGKNFQCTLLINGIKNVQANFSLDPSFNEF